MPAPLGAASRSIESMLKAGVVGVRSFRPYSPICPALRFIRLGDACLYSDPILLRGVSPNNFLSSPANDRSYALRAQLPSDSLALRYQPPMRLDAYYS